MQYHNWDQSEQEEIKMVQKKNVKIIKTSASSTRAIILTQYLGFQLELFLKNFFQVHP